MKALPNETVQRTGASRFAQRQIQHHRRLAPAADLCVRQNHEGRIFSMPGLRIARFLRPARQLRHLSSVRLGRSRPEPRDMLFRMLDSTDWRPLDSAVWRQHLGAITELRRRGEDVSAYVPRIISKLVSPSKADRVATHIFVKVCFPELLAELQDYSPEAEVDICRTKAASLLSRFGVTT